MLKIGRAASLQALRFFIVSVLGVIIDLAIAYAMIVLVGLPIWLATVIGFTLAALGCYFGHEYWTFRSVNSHLSARRALQYVGATALTLSARLAVIGVLSLALSSVDPLYILILAAGVSFFVTFAVSKLLIFVRRS